MWVAEWQLFLQSPIHFAAGTRVNRYRSEETSVKNVAATPWGWDQSVVKV